MVLTKAELIGALKDEIRILLHLASKVDPQRLDYRPAAKQRSTLELLQYLTIVGPIHLRTIASGVFSMEAWRDTWRDQQKAASARGFEETTQEIARLNELFGEVIGVLSDDDLRAPIEMFGRKASRGLWMDRPVSAGSLHGIPHAAVSLSEGKWPRGAEHDESVGWDGRAVLAQP